MNRKANKTADSAEKSRILITGGLDRMADNVMELIPEAHNKMRCPANETAFNNTIKKFSPDIVIICLQARLSEVISTYSILQDNQKFYNIPIVIVGYDEDCNRFKEKVGSKNIYTFVRPLDKNLFLSKVEQILTSSDYVPDITVAEEVESAEPVSQKGEAEKRAYLNSVIENKSAQIDDDDAIVAEAQKVEAALLRKIEKTNMLHGRQNILVVDDDVRMLNIIKMYLQDLYEVTVVPSGKLAIKYLQKKPCDLVLLDYMMPEMDGPEVLKTIRSETPNPKLPVLFLTGVSDKELVMKGLEYNPSGYLLKPTTREILLERVTEVLLGL